jgi:ribosomal-protein-alanine N-acetyltransferase
MSNQPQNQPVLEFVKVTAPDGFPAWAMRPRVVEFFHETMKPYEDQPEDIEHALDYAFSQEKYAGGFLMLVASGGQLAGALLMLNTGMKGYVPENILLFVSVNPQMRGQGIGAKLIQRCFDEVEGDVKLHVDFDNPARRLYERLEMKHKYAEMRLIR